MKLFPELMNLFRSSGVFSEVEVIVPKSSPFFRRASSFSEVARFISEVSSFISEVQRLFPKLQPFFRSFF